MATITARTSSGTPLNLLDPNTWVGGVVPGPADIAVLPPHPFFTSPNIGSAADSLVTPYNTYIYPWDESLDKRVRIRLNSNTGFPTISGSFLLKPRSSYFNYVKIDYNFLSGTTTNTYLHSCSIDRSFSNPTIHVVNKWTTSGSFEPDSDVAVGWMDNGDAQIIPYSSSINAPGALRGPLLYELTGSQTWAVSSIQMGEHGFLEIKDNATIYFSGSGIDFNTPATNYGTVIVRDSAKLIHVASTASNYMTSAAGGIYMNNLASNTVWISGSANYSSSVLTSQSNAGEYHLDVADASGFDVGDWISIEGDITHYIDCTVTGSGTGSYALTANTNLPLNSTFGRSLTDSNVYTSGSAETDEVVRIEQISGSRLYVSTKYSNQGYIQQDLGTFTYSELSQNYGYKGNYYAGSKRAILVDSNHHAYGPGQLVATDEGIFTVLAATSYLSESKVVDFTQGNLDPAQAFSKSIYAYSGSGFSGATAGPTYSDYYFQHKYMQTGSRSGKHSFFLNTASLSTQSLAVATAALKGFYFVSGSWLKEGEIELSGSLVQNFTTYSGSALEALGLVWGLRPGQREDYQHVLFEYGNMYTPDENNIFGARGNGSLFFQVDQNVDINRDCFITLSGSTKRDWGDNDFYDRLPTSSFSAPNSEVSLKVKIQNGFTELFANDVSVGKFASQHDMGGVALQIRRYASLFYIKIKNLYDLVVLDTEQPIQTDRDIREVGSLLETHQINKKVKWWATEIEDEMGHHNLVWDWYKKRGQTDIMPYTHDFTFAASTINSCQQYLTAYQGCRFLDFSPHAVHGFTQPIDTSTAGQNWITIDMGRPVQFDTIGISPAIGSGFNGFENGFVTNAAWNNRMRSIRFEVSDTPDSWQQVYALRNDNRISAGSGAIRMYTMDSGSVTARFIRYHNAGGTLGNAYTGLSLFGVYNFQSSSGYPSPTTNQIKLKSVKNLEVGDSIMLWSKQLGHGVRGMAHTSDGLTEYNQMYLGQSTAGHNAITTLVTYNGAITGGYTRSYNIVAISGSVVTLDRPVTDDYISRGTMVMKTNRGKVRFEKTNFTNRFGIWQVDATNCYMHIKNAYIQGHVYSYLSNANNRTESPGLSVVEDVGVDWGYDGDNIRVTHGTMRNIVTSGQIYTYSRYQPYLTAHHIEYNCFQRNCSGQKMYTTGNPTVYNHNTFLHCAQIPINVFLNNTYPYTQWVWSTTHIKNNFFESYRSPNAFIRDLGIDGGTENIIWENNVAICRNPRLSSFTTTWTSGDAPRPIVFKPTKSAYKMQYQAPNGLLVDSVTRSFPSTVYQVGGLIHRGVLMQDMSYNGDYQIALGNINNDFVIIRKDDDWYHIIGNEKYAGYNQCMDLGCTFRVNRTNDITFDLSFLYKYSPFVKHAINTSQTGYYSPGTYQPSIALIDSNSTIVIDSQDTNMRSLTAVPISYNKTITLSPGTYSLVLVWTTPYYTQNGVVGISYKDLKFNLSTDNIDNVTMLVNTWDIHKLIENPELANYPYQTSDKYNAVRSVRLTNTSNPGNTVKFNNVRI